MSVFTSLWRKAKTASRWKPAFANAFEWLKGCAVFLSGRGGGALSRIVVPFHLTGETAPLYLRCASSDFVTLLEVFVNREYAAVSVAAPVKVRGILDLGANIGLASRWFLQLWPSARIIAVEPDQANCGLLHRNLMAVGDRTSSHRIINGFVGNTSRNAVLRARGVGYANEGTLSDDPPCEDEPLVAVHTPAELLAMADTPIDVVKMDIEGSEKELLEGDLSWLSGCSIVAVEIHDPLDKDWLAGIVAQRLPSWEMFSCSSGHEGAHLAILRRVRVV